MTLKELLNIAAEQLTAMTTVAEPDFRLEEVEFLEKEKHWNVVVSFLRERGKETMVGPLANLGGNSPFASFERVYRTVKIDTEKNVRGLYIFDRRA